ncbi:MAG TPA: MBOAT family O-acyltransferase [Pirellulales bacterium]|nr:MBOAT family O-acyltransferase [Pirellulales bacterium]
MLFCSEKFLVFFTLVFALYWATPWHRLRTWLLLGASFYFYASWNQWLALIIGVSTTIDYFVARGMQSSESLRIRKLLLSVTIIGNLSLLCYFKYANFFLHSVEEALHAVGSTAALPVLQVILPIGISFYTFEAINYGVDVYRRRVPAERNLAHFMLFITFFPHLVAGPIVRARDFLPQIRQRKHWDWARLQLGAEFFLMGMFKKVVADRMAMFADPVFANPEQYRTTAAWLAVLAYALQIYCDFSGYTDMALGSAHMLGFKLAKNFNMPYASANISEFWRRWHISLSSWLRDYLFIPLGGSRGTSWQTNRNLLITMTLGGLWHGASWTFVIWGVMHGVVLIGHRYFRAFCEARPRLDAVLLTPPGTALRIALTFFTVSIAWIFFRATTFTTATVMLGRMFTAQQGLGPPMAKESLWVLTAVIVAAHVFALSGVWKKWSLRMPAPILGMSYAVLLTLTLVLAPDAGKAFIYFQF